VKQLKLFLESCRSPETRNMYAYSLNKFFIFAGELPNDSKTVENKIIEFLILLKQQGMSYYAISNYFVAIKSYYAVNDVILNVKKMGRYLPVSRRTRTDRSYTHQEISKLLSIADERMRVLILFLASTGIRIGAVPFIRMRNIQDNKIIVYEYDNEEYYTFITPECKKAIDFYLDMRQRYGEKINDNSYLIREQFDVTCPGKPKPVAKSGLQFKLYDLCKRCGIDKKNIAIAHGFRKFFTTQLVQSNVKSEIREMLLGHKIGLASAYYRPTEQEMFTEYEKATDSLTINEENRLRQKVEILTIEKSRLDRIEEKMLKMEQMYQK
jgi:integrase